MDHAIALGRLADVMARWDQAYQFVLLLTTMFVAVFVVLKVIDFVADVLRSVAVVLRAVATFPTGLFHGWEPTGTVPVPTPVQVTCHCSGCDKTDSDDEDGDEDEE